MAAAPAIECSIESVTYAGCDLGFCEAAHCAPSKKDGVKKMFLTRMISPLDVCPDNCLFRGFKSTETDYKYISYSASAIVKQTDNTCVENFEVAAKEGLGKFPQFARLPHTSDAQNATKGARDDPLADRVRREVDDNDGRGHFHPPKTGRVSTEEQPQVSRTP